ncbi:MAG: HEAT repeat domain-containing protein [Treponema sp.]|jgi:HEAT repeat protein|nr:HEAT repeat domain-containing protein [Treponema sp.]
MKLLRPIFLVKIFIMIFLCSQLSSQEAANPVNARRLNTLRYGTETEIAALIQTLRNEKDYTLDDSLVELFESSRNRNILTGIMSFFGEREKSGLEEKAIRIIEERDTEANETVLAAVDYLGRVNAHSATAVLERLIREGETRFLNNAIRALGRAARGSESKDSTALFLVNYYNTGNPSNENQREIIVAIGETGSSEGIAFLTGIVRNSEERYVLRMAALDSLGKIGDPSSLDAIIEAVSTADPNVRSSAIAALAPFSGEAADLAVLEGLRDSYYRTRIGAAQAAGRRRMEAAVPYLQYRAENDDVQAVKDEAIKALGAIWNDEAIAVLEALFSEQKNSDTIRILAGEMLLTNNSAHYTAQAIAALDDAKTRNQTALYNGFLRIVSPGISTDLEALARRFLASGTVIEKSYAMDMAVNNNFTSLEEEIRSCLDERRNGASLARKAQTTLEKLGFTVE